MTPAAALEALGAAGVRVSLRDDGTVRLDAAAPPPPEVLALARAHRDGIAALLLGSEAANPASPAEIAPRPPAAPPMLPGVPLAWCEGVALLAVLPAPDCIALPRWRTFRADAGRLLRDHGAELHRHGWDSLDLFGLHRTAPAAHPPGWSLSWLLQGAAVLDVAADRVVIQRAARLTYRRPDATARAVRVPAWLLGEPAA